MRAFVTVIVLGLSACATAPSAGYKTDGSAQSAQHSEVRTSYSSSVSVGR